MNDYRRTALLGVVCALLSAGCASTSEMHQRRQDVEQAIDAILTEAEGTEAAVESKRCLGPRDYDSIRVLDGRHILFEGRRDKLWVNTLKVRCHDLRGSTVLRFRSTSSIGRLCNFDAFQAGDWFDWPWYRRWPWHWGTAWDTGMVCHLGMFTPVTAEQLRAIDRILESR